MQTLDWKLKEYTPRALLIGHDPCLQISDTQAEYVLFANFFLSKLSRTGHLKVNMVWLHRLLIR